MDKWLEGKRRRPLKGRCGKDDTMNLLFSFPSKSGPGMSLLSSSYFFLIHITLLLLLLPPPPPPPSRPPFLPPTITTSLLLSIRLLNIS